MRIHWMYQPILLICLLAAQFAGIEGIYLGCYSDGNGAGVGDGRSRILPACQSSSNMSVEFCMNQCFQSGYYYYGLQGAYGDTCCCGNSLAADLQSCASTSGCASRLVASSNCNQMCNGNNGEICGGSYFVSLYAWAPVVYVGCYSDCDGSSSCGGLSRVLANKIWANTANNTAESCLVACLNRGFSYAGTEVGSECYCGNALVSNTGNSRLMPLVSGSSPFDSCNSMCNGNGQQSCGAGWRMSVYTTASNAPSAISEYSFQGCFTDGEGGTGQGDGMSRLFSTRIYKGTTGYNYVANTVESCTAACYTYGFSIAGMEIGNECWCSNSLNFAANGNRREGSGDGFACDSRCPGNSLQACGGAWTLSVYARPNTTLTQATGQCYTTGNGANYALGAGADGKAPIMSSCATYSNNSVEFCQSHCHANGYFYAGVQAAESSSSGDTCCCGNQLISDPQSCGAACTYRRAVSQTDCNKQCSGNSQETCGTNWRQNVYPYDKIIYLGCYMDGNGLGNAAGNGDGLQRLLEIRIWSGAANNTAESCMMACLNLGYIYAGTEVGHECWCGNSLRSNTNNQRHLIWANGGYTSCNVSCYGNSQQSCGAGWRVSVYTTASSSVAPAALSSFTYQGCYTDGSGKGNGDGHSRLLSTLMYKGSAGYHYIGNSVANCITACDAYGFKIAGLETGNECWCGNSLNSNTGTSRIATINSNYACNSYCPGDSRDTCGGSWAVSVYANIDPTGCYSDGDGGSNGDKLPHALSRLMYTGSGDDLAYCISACKRIGWYYTFMQDDFCHCAKDFYHVICYTISITTVIGEGSLFGVVFEAIVLSQMATGGAAIAAVGGLGPAAIIALGIAVACIVISMAIDCAVRCEGQKFEHVAFDEGVQCCCSFYDTITRADLRFASWGNSVLCKATCVSHGYAYAGLEDDQCWCDATVQNNYPSRNQLISGTSAAWCDRTCYGTDDNCGGTWSMYINAVTPVDPGWDYVGCFTDIDGGLRILKDRIYSSTSNNVMDCVGACAIRKYKYAGVEASTECWCGNELLANTPSRRQKDDGSVCNMVCPGNDLLMCGGYWAINIYAVYGPYWAPQILPLTPPQYIGCYFAGNGSSEQNILPSIPTTNSANTVESCLNYCNAAGYFYAGVGDGTNCACGNRLESDIQSGGIIRKVTESSCTVACPGNSSEICGDEYYTNIYTYSKLVYLGCYTDGAWTGRGDGNPRVLPVQLWSEVATTTPESCMMACLNLGYKYAGLEVGDECFCGNLLTNNDGNVRLVPESDGYGDCNSYCKGNARESCGGPWRMSVYSIETGLPAAIDDYTYQGCYTDGDGTTGDGDGLPRLFPIRIYKGTNDNQFITNTVESCIMACMNYGYDTAGMEAINECWCGNSATFNYKNNRLARSGTGFPCARPCPGNSNQICGDWWALSVYSRVNFATATTTDSLGCFSDGDGTGAGDGFRRILSSCQSYTNLTVEFCRSTCYGNGYFYAGVQGAYGDTCCCGNSLVDDLQSCATTSGCVSRLVSETNCDQGCSGNNQETCGGSFYENIYPFDKLVYVGCYADCDGSSSCGGLSRVLANKIWANTANNTAESCMIACRARGFVYAGTEVGSECYCGNSLVSNTNNSRLMSLANGGYTSCNSSCNGNSQQSCGAGWRMSVYTTASSSVAPAALSTYTYQGCYTDGDGNGGGDGNPRLLATRIYKGKASYHYIDNTVENCITACNTYGYSMAGLETGNECWCGNSLVNTNSTYTRLDVQSDSYGCNKVCPGDSRELCGGAWAISLYANLS